MRGPWEHVMAISINLASRPAQSQPVTFSQLTLHAQYHCLYCFGTERSMQKHVSERAARSRAEGDGGVVHAQSPSDILANQLSLGLSRHDSTGTMCCLDLLCKCYSTIA